MKKIIFVVIFSLSFLGYSQEKGSFFGSFESNAQWYLNDKARGLAHDSVPVRSNNYLSLNYKYNGWSAGIQGEAYQNLALLNLNPKYYKSNVGTYFLEYKKDKIDLTAGYFYEQFGSGLLYRSWEDRALAINNALRGGRIIFKPTSYITLKSIYGQQRSGFTVSNSTIFGTDLDISISDMLQFSSNELSVGLTYVGRDEKTTIASPNFNNLTNCYAGRMNFSSSAFYFSTEFDYKSKDAVVEVQHQIENNLIKQGNALLVNAGYSQKGFGVDGTFRRLENMGFYSERAASGNVYNDMIMNFVPSLTKQHHYNLANIYVYQAQPKVFMSDQTLVKAGEIGGQIDLYYNFKKGSQFGGKYGTKLSLNISNWNGLSGTYYLTNPRDYKVDFLSFGQKYFSDYNLELSKKLSDKWLMGCTYINQYYNKHLIEGEFGIVNINILAAEATHKLSSARSIRLQAEHLWADTDKRNWASATGEFNLNTKWSFFCSDLYNYGNPDDTARNHYYNVGGSYRKNTTRVSLNYGRQRGGLLCVGGVCRFVPESTGVSLSLNTTF